VIKDERKNSCNKTDSYPTDWGQWDFNPGSGNGLTPE